MKSNGAFHAYEGQQGIMDIYIARPANKEKAPVVIVLQEAFGVNAHIRSVCDRLAEEGFLAAAPDLYHREGRRIEIDYVERKNMMPLLGKLTNQRIIQDVRAAINFLEQIPSADIQNVNTIGFCVGGFASVLSATKLRVGKMISFYGGGMVHPREGISLTPILSDDVGLIEQKLTSSKVKFDVVIYPNSDHGFFCDERKSFDSESAENAWNKTLSFLRQE
jgi:carboxymethylenebutenolidase